jgi:hypothetical protein
MQIYHPPGKKNAERIRAIVDQEWNADGPNFWYVMHEYEEAITKAKKEILDSIKDMSDKDKVEQFKIKMDEWMEINPPPREWDDYRRRFIAYGLKPLSELPKPDGTGPSPRATDAQIKEAQEKARFILESMGIFPDSGKKLKGQSE